MSASSVSSVRALSNHQIETKMKSQKYFKGVYDADSLPHPRFTYPWAIIVNTEKDTVPDAGHWTAFVFDKFDTILIRMENHLHLNIGSSTYIIIAVVMCGRTTG